MLKIKDFNWTPHYANNIDSNPIEEYYCTIDVGNGHARKYSIQEQYPLIGHFQQDMSQPVQYYILLEAIGHPATDEDKQHIFYGYSNFDDYVFEKSSFIRVYTDLKTAQEGAYEQYKAIYGYVLSHMVDDVEAETQTHFCVNKN